MCDPAGRAHALPSRLHAESARPLRAISADERPHLPFKNEAPIPRDVLRAGRMLSLPVLGYIAGTFEFEISTTTGVGPIGSRPEPKRLYSGGRHEGLGNSTARAPGMLVGATP
jgi:hypothetical protein